MRRSTRILSIVLLLFGCSPFHDNIEETPIYQARRETALVQCSQKAAKEYQHVPLSSRQKGEEIKRYISNCMEIQRKNDYKDIKLENDPVRDSVSKGTPINAPNSTPSVLEEKP